MSSNESKPRTDAALRSGMPEPVVASISRKGPIIGFVVFGLIVAAVAVEVVRHRHHHSALYAPKSAVSVLLKAGETGNVNEAQKVMCPRDSAHAKQELKQLDSAGRVSSYRVDAAATTFSSGVVEATVTTAAHGTTVLPIPVVVSGRSWQVCLSRLPVAVTFAGVPAAAVSGLCVTASTLPGAVAAGYVYAAEAGRDDLAQACVHGASVPVSLTRSLRGKNLSSTAAILRGTGPFPFTGGGTTVTVTVRAQADAHDYVTGVQVG
jgi:hypothetical protein